MSSSKDKQFNEPDVPWAKSKARKLLYSDLRNGEVPLKAKDSKNRMSLREIYSMHEEYQLWDYKKFSSRVSSARRTIKTLLFRKSDDKAAFDNFVSLNPVSMHSHKGYQQWKGSSAFKLCLRHIKEGDHGKKSYRELYGEHRQYYENFPFKAFKDHYRSEIRTSKFVAYRKEFGETHPTGDVNDIDQQKANRVAKSRQS